LRGAQFQPSKFTKDSQVPIMSPQIYRTLKSPNLIKSSTKKFDIRPLRSTTKAGRPERISVKIWIPSGLSLWCPKATDNRLSGKPDFLSPYPYLISHSLYIWQQIFTNNDVGVGRIHEFLRIVLNLVLLAVVSYGSYNFFEKRFLEMKERLIKRP